MRGLLQYVGRLGMLAGFALATACSAGGGVDEQEFKSEQTSDPADEASMLPDCDDIVTQPSTTTLPTIRQVSGSDSLYVLVVGTTAICAGEFGDVADSQAASRGLVFDTTVWAGSNPMPGRAGSNPMPGSPSSSETPDSPGTSNPMPGKDTKGR